LKQKYDKAIDTSPALERGEITLQGTMSEALRIMTNALKEHRERRELETLKKTIEMLKSRKLDAVVDTFNYGTGKELLTELSMIVIYNKPSDYPDKIIARVWKIVPTGFEPTQYIALADTLEGIMEKMPNNKLFLEKSERDDPVLIGTVVVPGTFVAQLITENIDELK